jgi:hypothetical protein
MMAVAMAPGVGAGVVVCDNMSRISGAAKSIVTIVQARLLIKLMSASVLAVRMTSPFVIHPARTDPKSALPQNQWSTLAC